MSSAVMDRVELSKTAGLTHFECLKRSFEPLDVLEEGLSGKIIKFICDGEKPELLLWLENNPTVSGDYIYRPGRLSSSICAYHYPSRDLFELAETAVVYRDEFYSLVGSVAQAELAEGELHAVHALSRLGHVLQAIDKGQSLPPTTTGAPAWIRYLLNDLLYSSCSYAVPFAEPVRNDWRLEIIQQIAQEADLPLTSLLWLLLEKQKARGFNNRLVKMLEWEGAADWLAAQAATVYEAWKQFSVLDKCQFLRSISAHEQLPVLFSRLLVHQAVDKDTNLRELAIGYLYLLPEAGKLQHLADILESGTAAEKETAVYLLEMDRSKAARALLEASLARQLTKGLAALIETALLRMAIVLPQLPPVPVLPAVELPPDIPLSDDVLNLLLANWRELRKDLQEKAEYEANWNKQSWNKGHLTDAQAAWAAFSPIDESTVRWMFRQINKLDEDRRCLTEAECLVIDHWDKLVGHPEFTLWHALNLNYIKGATEFVWRDPHLQNWRKSQADPTSVDLRCIASLMPDQALGLRGIALSALAGPLGMASALRVLKAEAIWPFFAEHPEFLEEAMGLLPRPENLRRLRMGYGIDVIATFPEIPARYIAQIFNRAVDDDHNISPIGKEHALASKLPGIQTSVLAQLLSARQAKRYLAVEWLGRLNARETVPQLFDHYQKEKSEKVRAALLKVLESLGADLSSLKTSATFLSEATAGLAKKIPAALRWFPFDSLPGAHWQADGAAVAPEILRWWVVFAFKLRDEADNPSIKRYLDLLVPKDAATLSSFVLHSFIKQDTKLIPDRYPAKYHGSAMPCEGLLALTVRTPDHKLVTAVQDYMRNHAHRAAQLYALMRVCATYDSPLVIQFLWGIARSYRTAGTRNYARHLIAKVATRNGWTQDELADRTIPTAGFDADGVLAIDYAERQFTARLDAASKPVLQNSEGKIVRALPAARKGDDVTLIEAGKAQWTQSKKELKAVMESQTARLHETMCSGRLWPVAEWQEYLHQHPIVGRLIQRLVWLQTDEQGVMLNSFRPSEDGSLLDIDDNEIALAPGSFVRLAHGSRLDEAVKAAWLTHLEDYKVTPLFDQFKCAMPSHAEPE